jgi:nitrogen regulatory protein P-II 1
MKKIEAIIRTSKFEDVREALREVGIDFFSYWDATGIGNEIEKAEHSYRGTVYDTSYIPRQLLTIVVRDINTQKTVDAILKAAKTGVVGDGKIFVSSIEDSYRIRTGEKGNESLYNKEDESK